MTKNGNPVFAWLGGQHDNIGDSLLRRGYADALGESSPLVVFADGRNPHYESGLGLRPRDVVSATYLGWLGRIVVALVRHRPVLALNAGEYELTRGYFVKSLVLLPLFLLIRARGGSIIWLGAAVPSKRRYFTWLFAFMAKNANLLRWRDVESGRILYPAPFMPDWAFGLGPGLTERLTKSTKPPLAPALPPTDGRGLMTVSLRGDRPAPSAEWLELVRETSNRLGLPLCVVVQVERDSDRSAAMAKTWDAVLVPWLSDLHIEQEAILREVYSKSTVVVSDRLHALIMATTEGAVPLGWAEQAKDKLRRHFEGVGLPWVTTRDINASFSNLSTESIGEYEADRARQLATAKAGLADVSAAVTRAIKKTES